VVVQHQKRRHLGEQYPHAPGSGPRTLVEEGIFGEVAGVYAPRHRRMPTSVRPADDDRPRAIGERRELVLEWW
jgi:hypothetical protein